MKELEVKNNVITLNDREKSDIRLKIAEAEVALAKEVQLDIPPVHYFSKDVYAREIKVPKGSVIIGKIHKHKNLNIVSAGEISVLSIEGLKRIKAPCTFVSEPGVKRMAYVHEDTVWTTIHGTDEIDLEKIEEQFIAKNYDEVEDITATELKLLKGE